MQILLSTICMALTSAVIGNAYYQKKQFYPAVVHITKSNASMAVIYIQFFVIVFMFGKLLRKIFLGTLRAAEFEHLLERFWYALTEICLAFTVFRDDFNPRFVALFTVLLFLKSFHWLAEERVDFMERSPVISWLFHLRVASLLAFLGILDYLLLMHAYNSTIIRGPSAQLVFGFEYAILLTIVASTTIKYVLHAAEMRTDTPWENKAVFLLYTELVIGLIKVILYVLFVIIMAKIYALPMFVFRPMFFTIRNFKKALSDVIMSRRAIRNMNTLYPDATPEELRLSDNICIICREDMISNSKKLPCGHIFHTTCLRSWFQRQQTCPTCRLNILNTPAANSTALPRQENVPAAGAAAAAAGVAAGVSPANIGTPEVATAGPPFENLATANPLASSIPTFAGVPGFQTVPIVPPPFMMPPPFPFIAPYAIPPPPMPSDLTKFTDEDLKALEGYERKNIEERIKLLRNIQLMLDAAGILMNNYKIITARMHTPATQVEAPATVKAADSTTSSSPSVGLIFDEPSTSAAAAAAAAATTLATAANDQTDSVAAHLAVNSMTSITTTIQPEQNSPLITSATTPRASPTRNATINKLDEVTIEDLGVEDNENDFKHAKSSSKTTTLATIITTNDDTSELSELRKRRLKFLEEHNKPTSSAD